MLQDKFIELLLHQLHHNLRNFLQKKKVFLWSVLIFKLRATIIQQMQGLYYMVFKKITLCNQFFHNVLFEKFPELLNKVHFKSLTDQIDTSSPMGRFFFHIMASLSQMERELIVERTRAGLNAARRQGRIGGRKRIMTISKIKAAKQLLANGIPPREVASNLGVSIPTLYRWIPASSHS